MSPGNEFIDELVKDNLKAAAPQPSGPPTPKGLAFAEQFLRWVSHGDAYHTPIDEFQAGLGALWLSFCFDRQINPIAALHDIIDSGFPFKEALGSEVPEWLASKASARQRPQAVKSEQP